jgi:uncharacterized membrane protein
MQNIGQTSAEQTADIGADQRTLSAIGGSLLLYFVAKRHKWDSLLLLGGTYLLYRAVTGRCPVSSAWKSVQQHTAHPPNVNVRTHLIVNKPREEVYTFLRRLENWPLFMRHLENVDELDKTTSAWRVKLAGIGDIRWESRILKDEKNTELSWHSVPNAAIENTGKLNFSDMPGNATRIDVLLSYRAPAGAIGQRLSRVLTPAFGEKVKDDVYRFKAYFEHAGVV